MSDGGLRVTVDTQELDPRENSEIFALREKFGWFLFSEQNIKQEDVLDLPEIKPDFKSDKTPSQRLRGVLYRVWESQGSGKTFEEFYRLQIEKIIQHLKDKYLG